MRHCVNASTIFMEFKISGSVSLAWNGELLIKNDKYDNPRPLNP